MSVSAAAKPLLMALVMISVALAGCTSGTNSEPEPTPSPTQDPGKPLEPTLTINFTWSPEAPQVGERVQFQAEVQSSESGDQVTDISWDIDGNSFAGGNPGYTFKAKDNYLVTLSVTTNKVGTQSVSHYVAVSGTDGSTPPPVTPPPSSGGGGEPGPETPEGLVPHVIVAVTDSGINPYHDVYYRPHLTEHPSTYIKDFPADIPALPLSVGPGLDYATALANDQALWDSIEPKKWYWIPQTVFVAVTCDAAWEGGVCILDDLEMHGTGTTSSVISQNPDALIAFQETDLGGQFHQQFLQKEIPVDIFSISIGSTYPVAHLSCEQAPNNQIYIHSAGNDPSPTTADCWSANPFMIQVGGASAQNNGEETMARKLPDVVSYYCRPTAQTQSKSGTRQSYCGTSFAAPTVAGALSKVMYDIRVNLDYVGNTVDKEFAPGFFLNDLRNAMNRTASYNPDPMYTNGCSLAGACTPKNGAAPYTQWGWGFYDALVAETTTKHMLGIEESADKSAEARQFMAANHASKQAVY